MATSSPVWMLVPTKTTEDDGVELILKDLPAIHKRAAPISSTQYASFRLIDNAWMAIPLAKIDVPEALR